MLTHANFISNISTLAKIWELAEDDRVLMHSDVSHSRPGIVIHGMAYCGFSIALLERFDPRRFLRDPKAPVDSLHGSPYDVHQAA
jgi:long-subunit acyl-CoA synthetase (AMP-forming)